MMSNPTGGPAPLPLPETPDLDWLRKQAKRRLTELRASDPQAKLADAQFAIAREYGFPSWRALKAHIDSLTIEGQLFNGARSGDVEALRKLLDAHPEKLYARDQPYAWSLLHHAAQHGHLAAVDLLLERGLDANTRERGDNTYAMHWAAAAGHLEVVRRLADAGGDVVGHGDDHGLEVIGWATCWNNYHGDIADFLVSRGAKHNIFSAIALDLADEVRRIVAADPPALNRRMTRNENHRTPLHHAVLNNRPQMVALLLELGADPLAVDASGMPPAAYASGRDADRRLMERIREMTEVELDSAARGHRDANASAVDLIAALSLGDFGTAEKLLRGSPSLLDPGTGILHMMAKRNDAAGVKWLVERGADPNGIWAHWDSNVAPLHLAIMQGHTDIVRLLLEAGADPRIRDSKHDGDALDWAEFFERDDIVAILREHRAGE